MTLRSLTLLGVLLLLAACSTNPRQPAFLPPPQAATRSAGTLAIQITVDRGAFSSHYLSPSTKGITVNVTGPASVKKAAGLTVGASGCKSSLMTLQCELEIPGLQACPTARPCYDASVATYDAYDSKTQKIPRGAHALSADEHFTFAIASGTTTVPLVLQGIPKAIVLVPSATSTLTGNAPNGFVEPKCRAAKQTINVTALDADGNFIAGAGAPVVSLKSSDPAQFRVVPKTGNVFELLPPSAPSYPFGNDTVHLTVKASPGVRSGAHTVTATVNVAYSGDICGKFDEFTVPTASSQPIQIAPGPDGALWFTEAAGNKVGRITPSGSISEYAVPTGGAVPDGIVEGSDRNMWFTEAGTGNIGRATTKGTVREYPVPTSGVPFYITAGPDGNLWFTEEGGNKVASISTSGIVHEYTIPTSSSAPRAITPGPGGELWFTECKGNKLAEINTAGIIFEFPLATANAEPSGVVQGPDGRLWIAEFAANAITAVNSGGVGTSLFALPAASSYPAGIVAGPDSALWFTEESGRIGRLTVGGALTEYPLTAGGTADVFGITAGPDGAIWFTEVLGNKIGRIR